METYHYSQFNHAVVHVALFDDVTNAAAIRSRIVQAARIPGVDGDTEREAINFAFINARLVGIPTPVFIKVLLTMGPRYQAHFTFRQQFTRPFCQRRRGNFGPKPSTPRYYGR